MDLITLLLTLSIGMFLGNKTQGPCFFFISQVKTDSELHAANKRQYAISLDHLKVIYKRPLELVGIWK